MIQKRVTDEAGSSKVNVSYARMIVAEVGARRVQMTGPCWNLGQFLEQPAEKEERRDVSLRNRRGRFDF